MPTARSWPMLSSSQLPLPAPAGGLLPAAAGALGATWWAERWLHVALRDASRRQHEQGKRYARRGQVLSMQVNVGQINAVVQGHETQPQNVRLVVPTLRPEEVNEIAQELARNTLALAELMSGRMPDSWEFCDETDCHSAAGLFDFAQPSCGCPCDEDVRPCTHAAAVIYLVATRLDDDPFLFCRMRGCGRDTLLDQIFTARGVASRPAELEAETDAEPELLAYYGEMAVVEALDGDLSCKPCDPFLRELGVPVFIPENDRTGRQALRRLGAGLGPDL